MLKKIVKSVLASLLVVVVFQQMTLSAFAQSPRISPWLQMTGQGRVNSGPLGPYLSGVRPQQEMMKAYSAQMSQIQSQQKALNALQSGSAGDGGMDVLGADVRTGDTMKSRILAPPREVSRTQRNPAGFNQYLHYYHPGSLPRHTVPSFSQVGRR